MINLKKHKPEILNYKNDKLINYSKTHIYNNFNKYKINKTKPRNNINTQILITLKKNNNLMILFII